jgi:hypothetical protein
MREILMAELSAKLGVPIDVTDLEPLQYDPEAGLLAALPSRVLAFQRKYPGIECQVLRLPSVASILAGEPAPPASTLIAVLSQSEEIRQGARAMTNCAVCVGRLCDSRRKCNNLAPARGETPLT